MRNVFEGHKRIAAVAGITACAAALAMCLGGCTISETITQVIYDDDPNNPVDGSQSVMINDIDAKQTTTSLPKLVNDPNSEEKQDTDQDIPSYGEGTSNKPVPLPVKATVQQEEELEDEEENDDDTPDDNAGEATEDGDGEGEEAAAGEGEEADEDDGKSPDNKGKKQQDEGKGKNAKNKVKVYKDYGEFPEIPEEIKHVTAVGQAAVIVSMLGGTEDDTPLVGADANLLENDDAQKILANKGISNVKTFWKNDGASKGDLVSIKKIIKSDVELCFVMEGDDTFTDEQEQELLDNNIIVYELPDMASASKIVSAVDIVGQILSEGGNEQAGELASEYASFHNKLVKSLQDKNGGLTGGFNYDKGKKASTDASSMNTLYISDWDYSARYADENNYITTPKGVGVADLGYEEHPVSYYMSVGGASNVAAAGNFRTLSGYTSVVWQFTLTKAPLTWGNWTKIDREKVSYPLKGDGFDWCMTWSLADQCGLGTELYPAVVVADQKMKDAMEAESQGEHDAYYPYPLASKSEGGVITTSTVGFYTGSNLVDSCIGIGSDEHSVLNDGEGNVTPYSIYVNPCGAFSDWAEGGVESVLETSWIYQTFRDEDYSAADDVKDFYETFYDYELSSSELDDIMDGKSGEED